MLFKVLRAPALGSPCTATVNPLQKYCWWHDPANAQRRKEAASKAAKSKHPEDELTQTKRQLKGLAGGVLSGKVARGDAAVAAQILGILLRAMELEYKLKEQVEFEERLKALEESRGNRASWWAG